MTSLSKHRTLVKRTTHFESYWENMKANRGKHRKTREKIGEQDFCFLKVLEKSRANGSNPEQDLHQCVTAGF